MSSTVAGPVRQLFARDQTDPLRAARFLYYLGVLSVGQAIVRPILSVSASDVLFLLALVMTAVVVVRDPSKGSARLPSLLLVGLGVFVLGGLLSTINADSAVASVYAIARVVWVVGVWLWLSLVLLDTPDRLKVAMRLWVIAAAVASAVALAQVLAREPLLPGALYYTRRASGLFEHPNALGATCAIALAPSLMLAGDGHPGRARRAGGWLVVAALSFGLVAAGSVGAYVGAAAAVAAWLALARPAVRTAAVGAAVGLAVLVGCSVVLSHAVRSPLERVVTVTGSPPDRTPPGGRPTSASGYERIESYVAAWKTIEDDPIVGVGLGTGPIDTSSGLEVHNLLLRPWFEAGLFGGLGMLLVYVALALAAWRAVAAARSPDERSLAGALAASVVGFLVWGMGEPLLFQRFGWIAGALTIALWAQQTSPSRGARSVAMTEPRAVEDAGPGLVRR